MSARFTIMEFTRMYSTADACLDKLFQIRYEHSKYCSCCGNKFDYRRVTGRQAYQCRKCAHQIYPCAGTIFEKSRVPLDIWFYVMYILVTSKNGVAALEIQRTIGGSYKTSLRMHHKIMELMSTDRINWFSGIIEMDETFVGGKNKNRHKHKKIKKSQGRSHRDKVKVFGMLDRVAKKARCFVVADTSGPTLKPIIYEFVEKGSRIMTDEWTAYNGLSQDYKHRFVDHGKKVYSTGDVSTNGVENMWSVFKRTINGSYIHVSKQHMQKYVDEFVFRYNNKDSEIPIFDCLLEFLAERPSSMSAQTLLS